MKITEPIYKEMILNTRNLIIPRESYQRELNTARVQKIAANFDEHIANDPKVSFRDGHYYVFDGQHTIMARKHLNKGQDMLLCCKVFYGLSEAEEALLFAQQTGSSAPLNAGPKLRAEIFAGEPTAMAFLKATEAAGIGLDYGHERGTNRLACIATALKEFKKVGREHYTEALRVIHEAWEGDSDSLRAKTIQGMTRFVDLYYGEYDRDRLVRQCRKKDPLTIYRLGRGLTADIPGYKKYLLQVLNIYNGSGKKVALPMKF